MSPWRANYLVNEGGAAASDVRRLADHIKDKVAVKFGIALEEEVGLLGFGSTSPR